MTTEEVLRYHAAKYPVMRPTDAVKLLYQNEFGGGHLIKDPVKSLEWIKSEWQATPRSADIPKTVPIGNGIIRVNLAPLDINNLPLDKFNKIFVLSSSLVSGSVESFEKKLSLLRTLTANGMFAFPPDELDSYLDGYKKAGYSPVSHSGEYRVAYCPAYRVVLERLYKEAIK